MEYNSFTSLEIESDWYQSMRSLHGTIFNSHNLDAIEEELSARQKFLILLAVANDQAVGYKIGYQDRKLRFYSWLGGVHPDYRGRGIASELMRRQHEWCSSQGYSLVRTQTKNTWRSMLILNLRHGFDVVGTYTDEKGEPRIILERRL